MWGRVGVWGWGLGGRLELNFKSGFLQLFFFFDSVSSVFSPDKESCLNCGPSLRLLFCFVFD